jgi:hypothetical protein
MMPYPALTQMSGRQTNTPTLPALGTLYALRISSSLRPSALNAARVTTRLSMPLQTRSYLLKGCQMAVLGFGAPDCPGSP